MWPAEVVSRHPAQVPLLGCQIPRLTDGYCGTAPTFGRTADSHNRATEVRSQNTDTRNQKSGFEDCELQTDAELPAVQVPESTTANLQSRMLLWMAGESRPRVGPAGVGIVSPHLPASTPSPRPAIRTGASGIAYCVTEAGISHCVPRDSRKPEPAVRVQSDPNPDIEGHEDTKSKETEPGSSSPISFVSFVLSWLLCRFQGPSACLTNAGILASLVVTNQEDERQTMAATLPRERDSIAVLTNARR
jgi:hypothetical protein